MFAQSLRHRLFALSVLFLLVFSAAVSWVALRTFEPALQPELESKAATIGRAVAAEIARALKVGVPLEDMIGVSEVFSDVMKANPDIAYLALSDKSGKVLFDHSLKDSLAKVATVDAAAFNDGATLRSSMTVHAEDGLEVVIPVIADKTPAAVLHVGINPAFIGHIQSEIILDILTVLLVACLGTVELVMVLTGVTGSQLDRWRDLAGAAASGEIAIIPSARRGDHENADDIGRLLQWYSRTVTLLRAHCPWIERKEGEAGSGLVISDGRQIASHSAASSNIIGMRLSVFLFVMGEEMIRPFLPVYVKQFDTVSSIPSDWVSAAPVGTFMLIWALSQLFGPGVSAPFGERRTFLAAALLGVVSMPMMGLSHNFISFMSWRCLEALSFGMVLVTAQGLVLSNTQSESRNAGFASYVGGILTAGVCGPALGGVAAEQLGTFAAFLLGGSVFALSALTFFFLTEERRKRPVESTPMLSRGTLKILGSRRMLSLLALSGLPNRLTTTAILFYIFPLYLTGIGLGKADVGRILLLYYIGYIVSTPICVRLADRYRVPKGWLAAGGVLSGAVCLVFLTGPNPWVASVCCFLLGTAQGVSTLQASLITASCKADNTGIPEGTALGIFRFSERVGSAIAPFSAAALAIPFGYTGAATGMGVLLSLSSLLFLLSFRQPKMA